MLSGLHGDNSIVVTESLLGVKTCVYINCTDVTFIDVMVYEALQDIGASRSRATNATMSRTDGRLARGNQHRSMRWSYLRFFGRLWFLTSDHLSQHHII